VGYRPIRYRKYPPFSLVYLLPLSFGYKRSAWVIWVLVLRSFFFLCNIVIQTWKINPCVPPCLQALRPSGFLCPSQENCERSLYLYSFLGFCAIQESRLFLFYFLRIPSLFFWLIYFCPFFLRPYSQWPVVPLSLIEGGWPVVPFSTFFATIR